MVWLQISVEASIWLEKVRTEIQEIDTFDSCQALVNLMHKTISDRIRKRWIVDGQKSDEYDARGRLPRLHCGDEFGDTRYNLVDSFAGQKIVDSDQQHDSFRMECVELAGIHSPRDILDPVSYDSKVCCPREALIEQLQIIAPEIGDRITKEHNLARRMRFRPLHECDVTIGT